MRDDYKRMALSVLEGISAEMSRSFRREHLEPKPEKFLPVGDTIFSAPEKTPPGNSNARLVKPYDWLAELKMSERDPEGIDFATFNPD